MEQTLTIKHINQRTAFELVEKHTRDGWRLRFVMKMPHVIGTEECYELEMFK